MKKINEHSPEVILPGGSTLLIGPAGTGKTTALTTFIEAGIETFVLITDPNGEESLIDAMERKKLHLDQLHWNYVPAASPSWDTLITMGKLIRDLSYEGLTAIKSGVEKQDYQQFLSLLSVCANFKCQRTGN